MAKGKAGISRKAEGVTVSENQYRRLEDVAQKNDAIQNGLRARARYYEYIDSSGKTHKGETGANAPGGTYKAKYSEMVAAYSRESTADLEKERSKLKSISDTNYQKFTSAAASRSGSLVSSFASADEKIRMIDQILRRRKRKKQ